MLVDVAVMWLGALNYSMNFTESYSLGKIDQIQKFIMSTRLGCGG